MVLELLKSVNTFVRVRLLQDKEVIDNLVFRLHYRFTAGVLFAFSILCAANTFIGDPIDCLHDGTFSDSGSLVDTYCWVASTYTLPHLQNRTTGDEVVAPGVGGYVPGVHEQRFHTYYQWVPFMLFLQGMMFYLPHWLWKGWEDGKMHKITEGLRGNCTDVNDSTKQTQDTLISYIVDTLHQHNVYAVCYFFCEFLNFVNVVGNIFFVDKFLGGSFLTYGTKVIEFAETDQLNRTDPMIALFPRVTKCSINTYGFSGDVQHLDLLCVLPVNILNEKIYIFMWFWFITLAVLSSIALMYSAAIIILPPMRKLVLQWRFKYRTPSGISAILEKSQLGDFHVLHLLGRNMSQPVYHSVLEQLSEQLHDCKPRI